MATGDKVVGGGIGRPAGCLTIETTPEMRKAPIGAFALAERAGFEPNLTEAPDSIDERAEKSGFSGQKSGIPKWDT